MVYVDEGFTGQLYRWYEETEEPLWQHVVDEQVLSWWLRNNWAEEGKQNWFVAGYPLLAPYYANPSLSGDPMAPFTGYWWP